MRVAVLLTDNAFDSGLSTVCDIFSTANELRSQLDESTPTWDISILGPRRTVRTGAGHRVTAQPLDAAKPDLLIVTALGAKDPGGLTNTLRQRSTRRIVDHVAAENDGGVQLAAACTGTFVLAEAGVLDDRRATTSWWLGPFFRARYPAVHLDTSATLVTDHGISTAGAAFAHIDLALSLIQERSPALADLIARYLLIGKRASQANFAAPTVLSRSHPVLVAFERSIRSRLDEPVRIATAARAIGVSERTLQRITAETLGISPIAFVCEIRLDEATHLFRTTALSAQAIARRVGFANSSTLGTLIRRRRGTTLRAIRADSYRGIRRTTVERRPIQ